MENFIDKKFKYALIGASNDPDKYGNIVMKNLLKSGFDVIPVNPKGEDILGKKTFKTLYDIPGKIDVAITIVKPEVTEKILLDIKRKSIDKVWMQPGSESDTAIEFCKKNKIKYIFGSCIMIEKGE